MKKTILVVLSSMLLSGSLLANADAISQETTETGIVFTQKKVVSSPRNPKDPREPFIGKQGFIDTFEDDNEQNHSLATQANPKLLSCNEETDFGLSHVPANLSFGVIRDTELYLDLKLSRSNASLHIKQLNDFLKPYHCKISFLQNNPLQGEEHQIRFLYYNLLLGCNIDQIITTSPSLDQVTQLVLDVVPHITHTALSKIKLGFYIFQMSSKFGFFIDSEEDFIIQDSPFIKYDDFFKKIDGFEFLNDCPDLRTKQKECRYLYFLFCRANVLTSEKCEQYLLQIPSNNSPSIQYFLTQFQEKSQLSLKQHEIKYLTYNLALFHREAAIFSGRAKTLDLVKSVEKFNRVDDTVPKLIKKFTKSLYKENDEIRALIQNFPSLWHYYTILLWILSAKHHQPIKLLVQSSISSLHRQALITQIINGTSSPIEIYTYEQLNGEKPDGIVSNQPPEKNLQDVPFFPISLFYMDWHNKGNLALFIKQLETKKRGDKG